MSQSPAENVDSQTAINYVSALNELVRLVESGLSHSGHERNCCFLNSRNGRFADISVISGLDFQDDARAIAPVDWDGDGDLDLWVANRTGPQLRFLRNRIGQQNNHVTFDLQGTTTNRDAIGARVTLTLENDDEPIVRTLHAGSGFLSQGSKSLVIGLGSEDEIAEVVVRWPGGKEEKFVGATVRRRHLLVEGSGKCLRVDASPRKINLRPKRISTPASTEAGRVFLDSRPLLPKLQYLSLSGEDELQQRENQSPVLVNLWATWCAPCVRELNHFADQHGKLRSAGVALLALSVDGLGDEKRDSAAVRKLVAELQIPFKVGLAETEFVDKLELLIREIFGRHKTLPVPTSVLVDKRGHVAAFYFGTLEIEVLLADIARLDDDAESRRAWGDPFVGRWYTSPQSFQIEPLAEAYLHAGYPRETVSLLDEGKATAVSATSRNLLGAAFVALGDQHRAELEFGKALEANPNYIRSRYNLGVLYANQGKLDEATALFRRIIRVAPEYSDAHFSLAHAFEVQQRWPEAEAAYREALRIDPQFLAARNGLGVVLARRGMSQLAAAEFQAVLKVDPQSSPAHHNLGLIYMQQLSLDKAVDHLTQALEGSDSVPDVRNSLGVALMQLERLPAAVEQFRAALAIRPKEPNFHYNLAAALHRQRVEKEAIQHYRRAYELAPQRPVMANALAWMLATARDEKLRDPAKAVQLAEAACTATNNALPELLDTLAAAHASVGEWKSAESTARTAVTIAQASGKQSLAKEISVRLELYRNGKAYVEP